MMNEICAMHTDNVNFQKLLPRTREIFGECKPKSSPILTYLDQHWPKELPTGITPLPLPPWMALDSPIRSEYKCTVFSMH